ncbi:MAG: hypothetical protein JKY87_06630 [Mariprofundus sp.]|nr:hypothetical protein [Mariprofundus sp.]
MTTREQNYKHKQPKRMGSVKQFLETYPWFTNGGTRALLFNDTDGFRSECAIKIGSKVLIDFDAVDEWLDAHREAA